MFELFGDNIWLYFMQDDLLCLCQQGWFIDICVDFVYDLMFIDVWYVEVEEVDDCQWFELELGIQVVGQWVSLLLVLIELICCSLVLFDLCVFVWYVDEE